MSTKRRQAAEAATSATHYGPIPRNVHDQAIASAEQRGRPVWVSVESWLPSDTDPVLATDLGAWYVATWNGKEWLDVHSDEPIDCYITHWMHLPELPEDA